MAINPSIRSLLVSDVDVDFNNLTKIVARIDTSRESVDVAEGFFAFEKFIEQHGSKLAGYNSETVTDLNLAPWGVAGFNPPDNPDGSAGVIQGGVAGKTGAGVIETYGSAAVIWQRATYLAEPQRVYQRVRANEINSPYSAWRDLNPDITSLAPLFIETIFADESWAIPDGTTGLLIEAAGGGGGGGANETLGGNGSDTTIAAIAAIGLGAITAKGGLGGSRRTIGRAPQPGSIGGDIIQLGGAKGGEGLREILPGGARGYSYNNGDGQNGALVSRYLTGDNLAGQNLQIAIGGGGTGGVGNGGGADGQPGYVRLTGWGRVIK